MDLGKVLAATIASIALAGTAAAQQAPPASDDPAALRAEIERLAMTPMIRFDAR